jgi:hypothetical protein
MAQKKTQIEDKLFDNLINLFKDEYSNPLVFTPTQKELIKIIAFKKHPRVGVILPTQYGKSTATACGIILRAVALPERFTIIGGTTSKAEIIMGYVIDHIFDDEIFSSQLKIEGGTIERLKRERRRDHLTFKRGGEIRILSAEYRNRKRLGEALIGEGSQNVIIDDSVLCDDDQYAFIKRMVGGRKNSFILELANPLRRNHFYKIMTGNRYFKIWKDWRVAVDEGRFTMEFIDEMRGEKFFDIFYECKFPSSDMVDEKGFMRLLSDDEIDKAVGVFDLGTGGIMGVDIARGGNYNVFCVRQNNKAKIIHKDHQSDLMATVGNVIVFAREIDIKPKDINIDDTGLGGGVTDRLREQKLFVNGIKWGSASEDKKDFANLKAECYWRLREWIRNGGMIMRDDRLIEQLKLTRYKTDSAGRIIMMDKDDMKVLYGDSPDEADALALTFATRDNLARVVSQKDIVKKMSDEDRLKEFYRSQIIENLKSGA